MWFIEFSCVHVVLFLIPRPKTAVIGLGARLVHTRNHKLMHGWHGLSLSSQPMHLSPSRKVGEGPADVISIHSSQLVKSATIKLHQ